MTRTLILIAPILLAACSGLPGLMREPTPAPVIETVTAGGPMPVADDATASDASEPQSPGRFPGFSVTRLSEENLPGLWLDTPLVRVETTGTIVAENGRQIDVILRPTGDARGSGSRLSPDGFAALGLARDAQPTLTVIGDV